MAEDWFKKALSQQSRMIALRHKVEILSEKMADGEPDYIIEFLLKDLLGSKLWDE
jgi:hypothetical protein